jgi:hypothetical protein
MFNGDLLFAAQGALRKDLHEAFSLYYCKDIFSQRNAGTEKTAMLIPCDRTIFWIIQT